MASRPVLSREVIVAASIGLIDRDGPERFTLRRLGRALGCDPTAIYRHFRDKDELLRGIADELISDLTADLPRDAGWRAVVTESCVRLRRALVAQPHLAAFARSGPPLHPNEFALTERLLAELHRAGLASRAAAAAYHALIELTVGSAALDTAVEALTPDERVATYAGWRRAYSTLDPVAHPWSVAAADHLYDGTAEDRFRYALDRLLDGIGGVPSATPGP